MTRNLFQVMHICFVVVLSSLDADFESGCPKKDFLLVCCCLLWLLAVAATAAAAAKMRCSP